MNTYTQSFGLLFSLLGLVSAADASSLSVADCAGKVRAIADSVTSMDNRVLVNLAPGGKANSSFSLLQNGSSNSISCVVKGSIAECDKVPAGEWRACDQAGQRQVSSVEIQPATKLSKGPSRAQTFALAAGGLGTAAAVIALSSSSDDDDDSLDPTPTATDGGSVEDPIVTPVSNQPNQPSATGDRSVRRSEQRISATCANADEVDPLSPFS